MRYMGIDYGTKRVGVAMSDEEGQMAFPLTTLQNNDALCEQVHALLEEYQVGGIVFGRSENLHGEDNALQEDIDVFQNKLKEHTDISFFEEKEQYTTQEALRIQGRTPETDASAAALILNSFLMKQKEIS